MTEMRYEEKRSFELPHRPFFSIIVPCYNSRKTIGALLGSIQAQDMKDDIEVILSDDCSTESYQDIVDKYKDDICILQTKTPYNFAPGNTREQGVQFATGEWLAFADHDDLYIVDTLRSVKEYIIESGEKYYAIANFVEVNAATKEVVRNHIHTTNWNHAKFYNRDNMWIPFNVHFKHDLKSHEDIYISSCINCIMANLDHSPTLLNIICYIWNARPTSLSRTKYEEERSFLEVHFKDYIESTGDLYNQKYREGLVDKPYGVFSAISIILYTYFYTQGFKFQRKDWLHVNDEYAREYLKDSKETFGLSNKYILEYCSRKYASMYIRIRNSSYIGVNYFIEDLGFRDWLDYMDKDPDDLVEDEEMFNLIDQYQKKIV